MKRAKSTIKRGRLSKDEKLIIEQLCLQKTDEEIGHKLKRPPERVREYRLQYLTQNPHLTTQKSDNAELISVLHKSAEWEFIRAQYSKDELALFENSYASL